MNAYAYCEGDPVTNADPNGHSIVGRFLGRILSTTKSAGLEDVPTALLKNTKARSVMVRPIQGKHVDRLGKMVELRTHTYNNLIGKVRKLADNPAFLRNYERTYNVPFRNAAERSIATAGLDMDNAVSLHKWATQNIGKKGITREAAGAVKAEALEYDKLVAKIRKGKSSDWSVVEEGNRYRANKEKSENIGNRRSRNHLGVDNQT
nr:hypothetical protein [Pseudomonas fluorescens]